MHQVQHTTPAPTGLQMVAGHRLQCESVSPDDMALVDFDRKDTGRDGLYVLQIGRGMYCRRLEHSLTRGLMLDGEPFTPSDDVAVIGRVEQVFTPKLVA